jgi:O-antigen ligase
MGYATWAVLGLMVATLRWRKLLLIGPAVLAMFILFIPAVQDRFVAGFTPGTVDTSVRIAEAGYQDGRGPDLYTVTSGRSFMWPYVIEEIAERPLVGYGRQAMLRTGLGIRIWNEYGESFPHPHNAYLQWMHDNGILGILPIILFYFLTMKMAADLFVDKNDPVFRAVGGVTLVLVGALLIAAMGSQSFYPREGSLPMWCAMGLSLRCYVQRKNWLESHSVRSVGNELFSPV